MCACEADLSVPPRPPKVSVLIPTYNYARYLPEALDSVLAQSWTDLEIILSDDASTDDSAEIIRQYAMRYPQIRAYVQPINLGMVAHWNWCLQQATGEYVKFLFGDDCLLSPEALATLVHQLDLNPSASLATSTRIILDEHSRSIGVWRQIHPAGHFIGHAAIAHCLYHDYNLIGEPSAVMFRRAAGNRGFDPTLKQMVDLEFWFHLLLRGDLVNIEQPLCGFRRHSAQQTAANRDRQTGPRESLQLAAHYLPVIAHSLGGFAQQQILHRRLHYSRKRLPRSPEILQLEQGLAAQTRQPAFSLAALVHRFCRPYENLKALFRKRAAT